MSMYNHLQDSYSTNPYTVICSKCRAKYEVEEDDGTPGCRDVERAYCKFCNTLLAKHHGDCYARLIDDSEVDSIYKKA